MMQHHKYSLTELENMMLGKGKFILDFLKNISKKKMKE